MPSEEGGHGLQKRIGVAYDPHKPMARGTQAWCANLSRVADQCERAWLAAFDRHINVRPSEAPQKTKAEAWKMAGR